MNFWIESSLLIGIGFIASFLNTIGGGGSLFSVPILTFMGLPITMANATSRVALIAQNIFAVGGFKSKGVKLPWPYSLYLGVTSLVGGFVGSYLASFISDTLFNKIFAGVMLLAVAFIVYNPFQTEDKEKFDFKSQLIGSFLFFFIGVYGGFLQAGVGFLVIATLSTVNKLSLVKTNYVKVFVATIYTGISVIVFALEGKIKWQTGLILAIGHALGGWYASRWSVKAAEIWIKRIMLVTIVAMAIKLWYS
jgi:uncharacterized membrane protein YfcA